MSLFKKIGRVGRKLFSAGMGAPRAIGAAISGNLKDFKLFKDQSIGKSYGQALKGNTAAAGAVLGGTALGAFGGKAKRNLTQAARRTRNFVTDKTKDMGLFNNLLGGESRVPVSGGFDFGRQSTSGLIPIIIGVAIAVVATIIAFSTLKK